MTVTSTALQDKIAQAVRDGIAKRDATAAERKRQEEERRQQEQSKVQFALQAIPEKVAAAVAASSNDAESVKIDVMIVPISQYTGGNNADSPNPALLRGVARIFWMELEKLGLHPSMRFSTVEDEDMLNTRIQVSIHL